MLIKAKKLSENNQIALVDSYYDKLLYYYIGKPGMEWLVSPTDPYFNVLKEMANLDRDQLPNADLVVFLRIDYLDWIEFLKLRNRKMDQQEHFLASFSTQELFFEATQELCAEKGIELIIFPQKKDLLHESALRFIKLLKDRGLDEVEKILNIKEESEKSFYLSFSSLLSFV